MPTPSTGRRHAASIKGIVLEGMEVDQTAHTPTGFQDRLVQDQRIKRATVDTDGGEYKVEKYSR